jgi:hypothetical protein
MMKNIFGQNIACFSLLISYLASGGWPYEINLSGAILKRSTTLIFSGSALVWLMAKVRQIKNPMKITIRELFMLHRLSFEPTKDMIYMIEYKRMARYVLTSIPAASASDLHTRIH